MKNIRRVTETNLNPDRPIPLTKNVDSDYIDWTEPVTLENLKKHEQDAINNAGRRNRQRFGLNDQMLIVNNAESKVHNIDPGNTKSTVVLDINAHSDFKYVKNRRISDTIETDELDPDLAKNVVLFSSNAPNTPNIPYPEIDEPRHDKIIQMLTAEFPIMDILNATRIDMIDQSRSAFKDIFHAVGDGEELHVIHLNKYIKKLNEIRIEIKKIMEENAIIEKKNNADRFSDNARQKKTKRRIKINSTKLAILNQALIALQKEEADVIVNINTEDYYRKSNEPGFREALEGRIGNIAMVHSDMRITSDVTGENEVPNLNIGIDVIDVRYPKNADQQSLSGKPMSANDLEGLVVHTPLKDDDTQGYDLLQLSKLLRYYKETKGFDYIFIILNGCRVHEHTSDNAVKLFEANEKLKSTDITEEEKDVMRYREYANWLDGRLKHVTETNPEITTLGGSKSRRICRKYRKVGSRRIRKNLKKTHSKRIRKNLKKTHSKRIRK